MSIGGFVPNAHLAFIHSDKITKYLLNLDHETGAAKARFFINGGFLVESPNILEESIKNHVINRKIVKEIAGEKFIKYVVECNMENPNGTNPCITTVWIIEEDQNPRLITAYPK